MSSTTLYRLSGISLLLGAVVSVIASFMTLFFDSGLSASPSTIQSPLWSTYWSLAFITMVLVLMGLPALYLRQAGGRGGLLGLIGVYLVALSSVLGMATTAYFVSILPLLAAQAPNLINAGYETSLALFGLGATALSVIGPLLLGMAVIRAKVFPSLVGLLLMIAGVLSLSTVFPGVLLTLIGLVGTVSAQGTCPIFEAPRFALMLVLYSMIYYTRGQPTPVLLQVQNSQTKCNTANKNNNYCYDHVRDLLA